MSNEREPIDWTSLIRKEDWLVVWMAFIILLLATAGLFTGVPSVGSWWSSNITDALGLGDISGIVILGLGILVLTSLGVFLKKEDLRSYWIGYPVIFVIAVIAFVISKQATIKYYGLSYVLWALLMGLIISNITGLPDWLKGAIKTELYIKIGLVLLGACRGGS
jgi:hypothetical protein